MRTIIRRLGVAATGVTLASGFAFAAPAAAAEASVDATFRSDCTVVDVTSSRHSLSNVVLRFEDGDQKFEGLGGKTYAKTFSGTGGYTGDAIEGVFVKAGDNASGEGPGYGEWIPAPDSCTAAAASVVEQAPKDGDQPKDGDRPKGHDEPEADDDPKLDDTDANVAGHEPATVGATFPCGNTSVVVTSTKDLSNVVLQLSDGTEVKHEGLNGSTRTFTAPDGTTIIAVFIKSGANHSDAGPGYGEKVDAPAPTSCTESTPPATPVVPVITSTPVVQPAAVLAAAAEAPVASAAVAAAGVEEKLPAPVAARTAQSAEVLGVSLERGPAAAPASLARTGLELVELLGAAMALLGGGLLIVWQARRRQVA